MPMQAHRFAGAGRPFVAAEDAGAVLMEHPVPHQIVDPVPRLEGWIELDQRVGPEDAVAEACLHVVADPGFADVNEAIDIPRVVTDEPMPKLEDIHPYTPSRYAICTVRRVCTRYHIAAGRRTLAVPAGRTSIRVMASSADAAV